MRPLDRVLAHLQCVTQSGSQFIARCPGPSHKRGDLNPSLSLSETASGQVLMHCHLAGCRTEDILEALGLEWRDLFFNADHSNELDKPMKRQQSEIQRLYDYTDEEGQLLYQVVRLNPKGFLQRRPNGKGGWIWNLKGVQRVLYRLHKVREAVKAGQAVYIVEGEKDVEALEELGFTATCNPMGAGNWKEHYNEVFQRASLVLIPDNDAAGRKHMDVIARGLIEIVKELRVVSLPELQTKGDVSDWIENGGTAAKLKQLVQETEPFTKAACKPASQRLLQQPIGQLVSEVARTKVSWLWQGRLALGKLTVLDGDPGMGKSTLYCDLAARITSGRALPECDVREAGGVVIVTTEDGIGDTIRPRLEEAGANLSRCRVVQLIPGAGGKPDRVPVIPDDMASLQWAVENVDAKLLVIDPLVAHLGSNTSSFRDQDVRRALAPLASFAERSGVAVLVIRHLNKMAGGKAMYRGGGSIGIIGAARIGLMVGRDPEKRDRLILASVKNNIARRPDSLAFRLTGGRVSSEVAVINWEGTSSLSAQDLVTDPVRPKRRAVDEAEQWLREELSAGPRPAAEMYEAAEAAGIAKRTLKRALKKVGQARKIGFGSEGQWVWSLREESPKEPIHSTGTLSHLNGSHSQ